MVTKDIDQENVQEKLKGVDYELPIIRETPDPLKRWRLSIVQADEDKLILKYTGARYWMIICLISLLGGSHMLYKWSDIFIEIIEKLQKGYSLGVRPLKMSFILS